VEKKKTKKKKTVMRHSIGKQSRESVELVLKKKRKAMVGRICMKGRFKPGIKELRDDG